jgi:hypothetical protein
VADVALETYEAEVRSFLEGRLAAMGADAGGLANFYLRKLETGRILSRYDRELLVTLAGEACIVHAGIGIGQLSAALALQGSEVLGFEADPRRHTAAEALRLHVAPGTRYSVSAARFPEGLDAGFAAAGATLLFTNVVASWDEPAYAATIKTMQRFGRTILDLARFGEARPDPASRAVLAARLEAAGLTLRPLGFRAQNTAFVEARPVGGAPPDA